MPVNDAVTDSVAQVNTVATGETPAMAEGNLLLATSHAMGLTAHNSVNANQQDQLILQTVTVQGINSLFSTGNSVISRGINEILEPSATK